MSIHIFTNQGAYDREAVLVCSTEGRAFGPVIEEWDDVPASEVAEAFMEWLPRDPREYAASDLRVKYDMFRDELDEGGTRANLIIRAEEIEEAMGCGCPPDYHMADCPIRTGGSDDAPDPDEDRDARDRWEDRD